MAGIFHNGKLMKKYLALSQYYLPHKGGSFIWMHEVCRRIGNTTVLTRKTEGCPKQEMVEGIDVRRVRLERWSFLRPESLLIYTGLTVQMLLHSLRIRPGVIIAACVLPEGLVANIIGKIFGIPTLILAHGEEITTWGRTSHLTSRRQITSSLKQYFLWGTYKKADQIVANSEFTQQLLISGGVSPDKVAVVHPGTDPQRFTPRPKNKKLLAQWKLEGRKVLLSIGRLTRRKGQDMVIRALPTILQAIPEAVYLIVGTGDYETELKKMVCSLGLDSHARFLEEVADEFLPEIYNLADVFLMPNRVLTGNDVEGFGIVFLEAGASAIPVIGGQSGGVPDAIIDGETGILVDGNSPIDIAKAAIRILQNHHLAEQMGQAARTRVCEKLTWDHSAEKIRNLLNQLY